MSNDDTLVLGTDITARPCTVGRFLGLVYAFVAFQKGPRAKLFATARVAALKLAMTGSVVADHLLPSVANNLAVLLDALK